MKRRLIYYLEFIFSLFAHVPSYDNEMGVSMCVQGKGLVQNLDHLQKRAAPQGASVNDETKDEKL